MNAVEIEEAVSRLAGALFDPEAFPFAFLEAFGNKETTLKRLKSKSSSSNQVVPGDVYAAQRAGNGTAQIRNWAHVFLYVNGGLFSGGVEVPRFGTWR
jgi:hypothetical protein